MILPDEFWDDEEEELFLLLIAIFLLVQRYGTQGAAALLPSETFDDVDTLTDDVIQRYREQAAGMTDYNRQRVLEAWQEAGGDVVSFENEIESIYSANRARLTGITQVTSAFAIISAAVFSAAGRQSVWQTMNDARVCPDCAAMHNQVVGDGEEPPLHPGCRCWLEPAE